MKIYDHEVGWKHPPFLIAEIGANHDGDYHRALRLIELAADAGADAVKFQHFEASTIVSRRGFEDMGTKVAHQATWDKTVYETYEAASVPRAWTEHLSSYAHDHGIGFITTPYSIELADFVEPFVDAYKIGSGDITYIDLIAHVARKQKPWLLATGASSAFDIDRVLKAVVDDRVRHLPVLLQCNTNYTGDDVVSMRHLNLAVLVTLYRKQGTFVGLSDHTRGHAAVCEAVALGARVIEKHFTDDPQRPGPDHAFAMTPFEWRSMQQAVDETWLRLGDGVKRVEENEQEAVVVQRRALRWTKSLVKGSVVYAADVIPTRPCPPGALEPYQAEEIVGGTLRREVEQDDLVRMGDIL